MWKKPRKNLRHARLVYETESGKKHYAAGGDAESDRARRNGAEDGVARLSHKAVHHLLHAPADDSER
jgi:hypothetical protein